MGDEENNKYFEEVYQGLFSGAEDLFEGLFGKDFKEIVKNTLRSSKITSGKKFEYIKLKEQINRICVKRELMKQNYVKNIILWVKGGKTLYENLKCYLRNNGVSDLTTLRIHLEKIKNLNSGIEMKIDRFETDNKNLEEDLKKAYEKLREKSSVDYDSGLKYRLGGLN